MHVVAHHPSQTSVTLWVQADESETDWTIEVVGPGIAVATIRDHTAAPGRLPNVLPGQRGIRIWVHQLTELAPGPPTRCG